MTNTAFSEMQRLREGLQAEAGGTEADLTTFDSGSAMLDVRRAGRAFVMAYTPRHGFSVDELRPDDGFVLGYRFVFDDFESAARQLRAMATAASPPTLSLVVLQSGDLERAKDFYSLLGLTFAEEQHGTGPRHYSTMIGALVLEIYPCPTNQAPSPGRLGFRVASLDQTLETLRKRSARIIREAQDSPWGRRAVVEDPDGNRVELTTASPVPAFQPSS